MTQEEKLENLKLELGLDVRFVPGTKNNYLISEDARVWSAKRDKIREMKFSKQARCVCDDKIIPIIYDGIQKRVRVDELMMDSFGIKKPSELHEIHHINWDFGDNRLSNLRWVIMSDFLLNEVERRTGVKAKHVYDCKNYCVTEVGEVWSFLKYNGQRLSLMTPYVDRGRIFISIRNGGRCQEITLNKLVADMFVYKPTPSHDFVIHIDDDKANCKSDNLLWNKLGNYYEIIGDTCKIRATNLINGQQYIYIDTKDLPKVFGKIWYISKGYGTLYARSSSKNKVWLLHREIMEIKDNEENTFVDHINHDGLDNRRENLRVVNKSQNCQNARPRKGGKSTYKGVSRSNSNKWSAYIQYSKKRMTVICLFEIEAAIRYNQMALKYHGEYACLNKIRAKVKGFWNRRLKTRR